MGGGGSTIRNHLAEVNKNVNNCKDTGKVASYPLLGPYLVKDLLGMGPAVDMLIHSFDPGRLITLAHLDTFRSSQSTFSTVWKVSIEGLI